MVKIIEQIPIEQVFYGRFVTYEALSRIVRKEFVGSRDSKVNIYIDLFQLLTPPHGPTRINDFFIISSCVLNYCAHLRVFFRRRFRTECRIILVSSEGMYSKSKLQIPTYNNYYNTRIKNSGDYANIVLDNMNVLNVLCPYLPEIYFKHCNMDAAAVIKYMIDNIFNDGHPNIVISSSQLMYQLPVSVKDTHTIVIRPARFFSEDKSYSYNAFNCLSSYLYDVKKNMCLLPLNPDLVSFAMILCGIPKLSIKSIVNTNIAIKILANTYLGTEHDWRSLYNTYSSYYMTGPGKRPKKKILTSAEFKSRFMAIDLMYKALVYDGMAESKERNFLIRKDDPDTVKKINDNYFKTNPINLQDL